MSELNRYVMLGNYAPHGASGISSSRTKRLSALAGQLGGSLVDAYALLGQYDIVVIVDLPNNDDALKLAANLQATMGISWMTLPAISIEKLDRISEDLRTEIESARMEAGE